jgi:hypothetical protein
LIKDYELEVNFHPGKANIVADALRRRLSEGDPKVNCFREQVEGTLWFKDRLVVPKKATLKKKILDEAHTSRYSIHPGSTKMYHDLR